MTSPSTSPSTGLGSGLSSPSTGLCSPSTGLSSPSTGLSSSSPSLGSGLSSPSLGSGLSSPSWEFSRYSSNSLLCSSIFSLISSNFSSPIIFLSCSTAEFLHSSLSFLKTESTIDSKPYLERFSKLSSSVGSPDDLARHSSHWATHPGRL